MQPAASVDRARARGRRARVIGRALAYWAMAATIICLTMATRQWAEERALERAALAAAAPRVDLAQRRVVRTLDAARADLHLLASLSVIGEFLRAPDPAGRRLLDHDLFGFMATRAWCRRVVVRVDGRPSAAAERRPGVPSCDALNRVAAAFPDGEALLAVVPIGEGHGLCLGVPLGGASDARAVLMAEADPRELFAELLPSEDGGVLLRAAEGQWLLAPDAAKSSAHLHAFPLPSWSGPSAGSWAIAIAPVHAGAGKEAAASRRHNLVVCVLLLLASAAGALALARAADAHRRAVELGRIQLLMFQRVSDNVPTPIYLKDRAARYLSCNAAFEALVGRPRGEIIGQDVRALLPAGTTRQHEQADRDILSDGMPQQYETQVVGPDGRVRDLLVCKAPVRDEAGRVTGLTAALLDISERKAAERELRRSLEAVRTAKEAAEAGTRAKSEFLAMMSHEMRTPLHAVMGGATLLAEGPLDREQREQVTLIETAGRAMLDLVDDLLDFSRIESGRFDFHRTAFDVRRLCEETTALVARNAHDRGVDVECVVDAAVPRCASGDPGRLRQVLLNLLSHAFERSARGTIRARLELVRRDREGVLLRLRVRDSGDAIPAELLPRLFEPFSASADGQPSACGVGGLGLALTRRLVELMGGTIEAAAAPDQGCELRCTMRLGEAAAGDEPQPRQAAVSRHDGRPFEVLLVEDNRVNQHVTTALLGLLDCQVEVVGDGAQALEALARRRYDLVFMDCRMPGMSGYEAAREIRRREGGGPHVPIVALTANALRGDRERCLAAGMTDYLAKPVDLDSLRRVLGLHAGQAPAESVPEPAGSQTSLVDSQALAQLRMLEREGPGFLATIVREFDEGARQRLTDMQAATRCGDGDGLHGAAHSLKGSSGIFGARGIAELCLRIEDVAEAGKLADAPPLIVQLMHEHEALMKVLQEAAASAAAA